MKLYMKQKIFTWKDQFEIKDKSGEVRYYVKGELISLGHKLHIYDQSKKEVAFVREKLITIRPKYEIYVNDKQVAELVKQITLFKPHYELKGKGLGWKVEGRLLDHDYVIKDGWKKLAKISKAWFSWGDSYEIDIDNEAEEILVLASVLAIDCVIESDNSLIDS